MVTSDGENVLLDVMVMVAVKGGGAGGAGVGGVGVVTGGGVEATGGGGVGAVGAVEPPPAHPLATSAAITTTAVHVCRSRVI
jgi:hypothetical protein